MPTVEEILPVDSSTPRALGNRRSLAVSQSVGVPSTAIAQQSSFFIGDVPDGQPTSFGPVRAYEAERQSSLVARAPGNRRFGRGLAFEGPLGPRGGLEPRGLRSALQDSRALTPEQRLVVQSPNTRSRDRPGRTVTRHLDESFEAPSPSVVRELFVQRNRTRQLESEMADARQQVELWTTQCEKRAQHSEENFMHQFEVVAHEWTKSRDAQSEQMEKDWQARRAADHAAWLVESGRLEVLRSTEVQTVQQHAAAAMQSMETDLHRRLALEEHSMNQSFISARIQQQQHYQSEMSQIEASRASPQVINDINRLRSELTSQAAALQSISNSSAQSTHKFEESLCRSHDRCEKLTCKLESFEKASPSAPTSLLQEVNSIDKRIDTLSKRLDDLANKVEHSEKELWAAVTQVEDQVISLHTDARASRAQSTATFGSETGDMSSRGVGQPTRVNRSPSVQPGAERPTINPDVNNTGGTFGQNAGNAPNTGGSGHFVQTDGSAIPVVRTQINTGSKERDEVTILPIPSPSQFRTWKTTTKITIASASSDPDSAFAWIMQVEASTASVETLFDSGQFKTLDAKLSAALGRIVSGELARQISIVEEDYAKKGLYMKGRQKLHNIYHHFQISKTEGSLLEWRDLLGIHLLNGDMRQFQTSWDLTLASMDPRPEDTWLNTLYRQQVEKHNQIREMMNQHELMNPDKGSITYEFLHSMVIRWLEARRRRAARDEITRPGAALAAQQTGICRMWQRKGACANGDRCNYSHPPEERGKEKGKGKGKGKRP